MTAPGVGTIVAKATSPESRHLPASPTPPRLAPRPWLEMRRPNGPGLLFEAAKVLLSRSAKPNDLQAWGRALA